MTAMERIAAYDNQVKGSKLAKSQRNLALNGDSQYIGRPQGPKAKGHKTPATGILPYIRSSVIPK